MIMNYLKVSFRNLVNYKGFSLINIAGLAIGLACCIVVFIYVQDELRFDKFHKNSHRIYRTVGKSLQDGQAAAIMPAVMLPHLLNDLPQIEKGIRIASQGEQIVSVNERRFIEKRVLFADKEFFDVFTFPLKMGESDKVLSAPFSVVISESMARKYFGEQNPLGQIIRIDNEYDFTITGVARDLPEQSHLQFDFIASISSLHTINNYMMTNWQCSGAYIYLLLPENSTPEELMPQLDVFLEKNMGADITSSYKLYLEPLLDIHLRSSKTQWDLIAVKSDVVYVYGFSLIAFLILVLACLNYMNLATARSNTRAREVGVRKTLGAFRLNFIFQYLGETLFLTTLALFIAMGLVEIFLPSINNLFGKHLEFDPFTNTTLLLILIGFTLFASILAGGYPAFILSDFNVVHILKGGLSSSGVKRSLKHTIRLLLRQGLVFIQFAVSIAMIICTLLIYNQLNFIRGSKLGFNKEHKVIIENPYSSQMLSRYSNFKNRALQNPQVEEISAANNVPPDLINNYTNAYLKHKTKEEAVHLAHVAVDHDFHRAIGNRLLEGRYFSSEYEIDGKSSVILNESAVEMFKLESPIGEELFGINNTEGPQTIIGIVEDMHYRSFHHPVQPTIFYVKPWGTSSIVVKIRPENVEKTIKTLQDSWKSVAPEWPFRYSFMDEEFDKLYRAEMRTGQTLRFLTILAVFISCLGLFGLATFSVEQRTKEIGIRKVLGASATGLVAMLSKEFSTLILLANLVAWPIAYFTMNKWLQNFAYRIDIGWWIFVLAGLLALVIALLTVSWQAIRAAMANPVEALRYE